MSDISPSESIDVRGKIITTFILYDAVKRLETMAEGQVLEIVAGDFEAIEGDIAAWCRMTGHKLAGVEKGADAHRYYIEKAPPNEHGKRLAMVISDPGLEQLLSPLGFALGAALSGTDVSIYFQGPATKALTRGFKGNLRGLSRPFSGFARKGMAAMGHVPPPEKLRQLRELGAHLYVCGPSMDHFGVKKGDLVFDDIIVAEYLAFTEIMNQADVHVFLQ